MRCDEIQERFVDLLYDEQGTPRANEALRAHIDSCSSCRRELEQLRGVQSALRSWRNEPPMRPVWIPGTGRPPLGKAWRVAGYGAVAAAALLAFLALANAELTWTSERISFKTHLFGSAPDRSEYATHVEVRRLLKIALDDTEGRINETNYLMIQRMLETVEAERRHDLMLIRRGPDQNRAKN